MNIVKQVVKWLQDRKTFSCERKSNEQRAQGILLYHAGLSYEKAGIFTGVSYEAVREWYQKGKELFEASTKRKVRKWVAVDEKEIKINGTTIFIWDAVDIDHEKVMAVWVSFGRSSLEAAAFLKKVRAACDGRLPRVFVDGVHGILGLLIRPDSKDIPLYLLGIEALLSGFLVISNAG